MSTKPFDPMDHEWRSVEGEGGNLGSTSRPSEDASHLLMNHVQTGKPESILLPKPVTSEFENNEFWILSGKPYFHVVLTKSHVKPNFQMVFPTKLHSVLPNGTVPAIVTYNNKTWETMFQGDKRHKRLDKSWKNFVNDNALEMGDALVFELVESCKKHLKLRVQILRGYFPSELLERVSVQNSNTPIVLD